jgi:hypothetical protein
VPWPVLEEDKQQRPGIVIADRTFIIDGAKMVKFIGKEMGSGETKTYTSTDKDVMALAKELKVLWGTKDLIVKYYPFHDDLTYQHAKAKD